MRLSGGSTQLLIKLSVPFFLGALLGGPAPLSAQGGAAPRPAVGSSIFASTHIELTPYLWAQHINSDDQLGSTPLDSDLDLGRIMHSLKALAELEVVGRNHSAFVLIDGIYSSLALSPTMSIPGLDHITLKSAFATTAGGYSFGLRRVLGDGAKALYVNVQPFGGAAYTDIALTAQSPTGAILVRGAEEWWMPLAGVRLDGLSGHYTIRLAGNFSDFGNHQKGEQILGAVGHVFDNRHAGGPIVQVGYRYLYEKKVPDPSETLRVKLQGPVIFFTFHVK